MKNIMMKFNIFVGLRMLVALIFIVSGTEKLLSPVENFIYALQSYEVIPTSDLEFLIATAFPWMELLVGVFLLLGLWTKISLKGTGLMACGFIMIVGQGLVRRLPLVDCGCFGDLMHFPIWVTFTIDWVILGLSILLFCNINKTKMLSLDFLFD